MSSNSEKRHQSLFPLQPQSLTGATQTSALLAIAAAVVLALFLLDALTPKSFTFSFMTLGIFPIIAVAWQLPLRHLVALLVLIVVLTVTLGLIGELEWYRVLGQCATAVTVAGVGRVAAVQSAAQRKSRERELAFLLDTARSLQPAQGVEAVSSEVVRATSGFLGGDTAVELVRVDDGRAVVADQPALLVKIRAGSADYELRARGAGEPTAEQLRVVNGIAEVARLALADATKLEAERARARTFESLHEFSIRAALAASPEEVAELLVDQTVKLLDQSQAVLGWQESPGEPMRVMAATRQPERLLVDARQGAAATALREQRTLLFKSADLGEEMEGLLEGDPISVLVAPLLVKGVSKGVLIIGSALQASDEDVLAISLLTSQTAPILNDAQLRLELEQSERRYRSLYHSFGCGVLVHDHAGRLIDSNWAAEDILGLTAAELRQQPPFGAGWKVAGPQGREVPPAMRPPTNVITFRRPLRKLIARVTAPKGDEWWLRIDSSPVEEGRELKMVVTSFFPVPPPD